MNTHKGSKLLIPNKIEAIDNNTKALFHFDGHAMSTNGIAPNSGDLYTIEPWGKFGKCIVVEDAATNISLLNGQNGVSPWGGDTSLASSIIDPYVTFRGRKVAKITTGSSGNCYINGASDISTATTSSQWASSCYMKRLDGTPITTLNGYLYVTNNANVNGVATIQPAEDGWYRVIFTRTGLTAGYPTLAGFWNMGAAVEYYLADWQVEAKGFASSYTATSRANGIIRYTLPDLKSGDFTISMWSKCWDPDTESNYYFDNNHQLYLINYGTRIILRTNSASVNDVLYNNGRINEWIMLTVTKSDNTYSLYVDGILVGSATQAITFVDDWYFGVSNSGSGRLNGSIDELRIDKIARTQEEIYQWYICNSPFHSTKNDIITL
jgi:hypothetical protein